MFGALADPTRRAVLERLGEGDAMEHLVVSLAADPHGFVDEFLAKQGRSRRIALTVPNFMLALAVIAETDLISALPRTFVAMHGEHFGIVSMEAKIRERGLPKDGVNLRRIKAMGFSDRRLAELIRSSEDKVARHRRRLGVRPVFKRIDTCAAEFASPTAYMYSSYETGLAGNDDHLRLALVRRALRRHERHVELAPLGHYAASASASSPGCSSSCPAIVFPRSTACSIVPTM